MKIGILTFHRACNYGAVLQCYALQEALTQLGHEACVIDYRQVQLEAPYLIIDRRLLLRNSHLGIRGRLSLLRRIPSRAISKLLFTRFLRKHLRLTASCYSSTDIPAMDAYIIGSDQMWNFSITGGKDDVYLGKFDRPGRSRLLGYAISTNATSLRSITDNELRTATFTYLSFREQTYAQSIQERIGCKINVDIDPTLLMGHEFWERLASRRFANRRYVLLYKLREGSLLLCEKTRQLAKMMHCEVIEISGMTGNTRINKMYSPEDFVSLFRYAQCVVTDSFHGTAFSVIFERPLYAVKLGDSGDVRYENLLRSIAAGSLIANLDFEPQPRCFDYSSSRARLLELQQESLSRLKEALS